MHITTERALLLTCVAATERGAAFLRVLGDAEQQAWGEDVVALAREAAAGALVADACGWLR